MVNYLLQSNFVPVKIIYKILGNNFFELLVKFRKLKS